MYTFISAMYKYELSFKFKIVKSKFVNHNPFEEFANVEDIRRVVTAYSFTITSHPKVASSDIIEWSRNLVVCVLLF